MIASLDTSSTDDIAAAEDELADTLVQLSTVRHEYAW
jgi:hypothetical protein